MKLICILLSNKECPACHQAEQYNVPVKIIPSATMSRTEWEETALQILQHYKVDLIILWFYRIFVPLFIQIRWTAF